MNVTTLIVCSAGASNHAGRSGLAAILAAVRREAAGVDVVDAFIDHQQPSIADVVRDITGERVIVPLTLLHDERLEQQLGGTGLDLGRVAVTTPLGPDWALAELGVQRLIEAGARPGDEIVMAAGNVRTPEALADLSKAARLLSAVWGGRVHVGSLEGLGSPISEAIDIARAYGRRVIVSVYELTASAMASAIGKLGADVVTAPFIVGATAEPTLVRLVLDRLEAQGTWVQLDISERPA